MSVNAQLAQGSKVYIEGSSGGTVTVTAISKALYAEVTGTHALSKGDRVTFASVGGMTEINGLSGVVVDVTSTTKFCVNIDSRGFTAYTSGGTATPVTWTQIKEIKSFKPGGASSTKIDVTDLDSTAKEYRSGLVDNGTLAMDVHPLPADPGQEAVKTSFDAATVKTYKIQVLGGNSFTFEATVTKFPTVPDGAVDGVLTGSIELQISGAVTKA